MNLSQLHLTKTLALLTAKRVLKRRSTLIFLMIGLFPCLIFFFWILERFTGIDSPSKPYGIFLHTQVLYYLTFYVPLLGLFLGLGSISDEIETKNITFTLTRPLHRISIAAGRVLGHMLAAVSLVCISLTVNYVANMFFQFEDFFPKLMDLINGLIVLSLGVMAYLSLVTLLGTVLKKFANVLALIWLGVDFAFSLWPVGIIKYINIRYRMLSSYQEMLPQIFPSALPIEQVSLFINVWFFLIMVVLACVLTGVRLSFEIVLGDNN